MSERWLRLYEGVVHDPKLQKLPAETFRGLINIWCVASGNEGRIPPLDDLAFILRKTPAKTEELLSELRRAGLIDEDQTGFYPHNWEGRQFKSDVSTSRVRQFRKRKQGVSGNADETLHETAPEQSRAETEQSREKASQGSAKKPTRLASDWKPSLEDLEYARSQGMPQGVIGREAENFRDYWVSKAGKDAAKLDWAATWRTWVRRACERGGFAPPNGASVAKEPEGPADWQKRLAVGRERRQWPTGQWGPMPNQPGCLIPPDLIRPDDGKGWAEWGQAA